MLAGVNFEIKGVRDVLKALDGIEPKIAKKILRSSMRKGMKTVRDEAKRRVPVDEGDLKASIRVVAGKRSRKSLSLNVQTSDSENLFTGEQYHGAFVEFGREGMAPQPYMRPAYLTKKAEVKSLVENEILQKINDLNDQAG